jgi:threonyl-tRNA synthetase
MERFIAILLEHTAGNFPLANAWTGYYIVFEKYEIYAKKVLDLLEK